MIFGVDEKPSLEEALEHFGIKGMRWGVRRDPRNVASRARDRQGRRAARAAENREIDAARARLNSGQIGRDLKDAKTQFKSDKKTIGRREAKKKLYAARLKAQTEFEKAQTIKSGSETAIAILGVVGGTVLAGAIGSRLRP